MTFKIQLSKCIQNITSSYYNFKNIKLIHVNYEYILKQRNITIMNKKNIFCTILMSIVLCLLDSGCFPSTAKVHLKNGKVVTMSELKIGDQIQTGTNINE